MDLVWEQRKLADAFSSVSNNTLSRAELNDEKGALQDIHYGDVLIKYSEYLDVSSSQIPYISDDTLFEKYKGSFLKDGDVIIADTAEDTTVGKCTEIGNIGENSVVPGLHTIPCRPVSKFASGYLGFYMNSNAYHDQLIPLIQGIKVSSISKSALLNTYIKYPKDLVEQQQIGAFFKNLDDLITLHQRKQL